MQGHQAGWGRLSGWQLPQRPVRRDVTDATLHAIVWRQDLWRRRLWGCLWHLRGGHVL
jgi:hypothetical protein